MINEKNQYLSKIDQFCMIFSALAHDVGHPGVNNLFIVNLEMKIANKCNLFIFSIKIKDND